MKIITAPTIACHIGKHKLCDGHGTDSETGKRVQCNCPCHKR